MLLKLFFTSDNPSTLEFVINYVLNLKIISIDNFKLTIKFRYTCDLGVKISLKT